MDGSHDWVKVEVKVAVELDDEQNVCRDECGVRLALGHCRRTIFIGSKTKTYERMSGSLVWIAHV